MAEGRDGDVVLGDDWVSPNSSVEKEILGGRRRRGWFSFRRSPLTRKIITFNLVALSALVAGILYLSSSRDTLIQQRAEGLQTEAKLLADIFEVQLPVGAPVNLVTGDGIDVAASLALIDLQAGTSVVVYDTAPQIIARKDQALDATAPSNAKATPISDAISSVWQMIAGVAGAGSAEQITIEQQAAPLIERAMQGAVQTAVVSGARAGTAFAVAVPFQQNSTSVGVILLINDSGETDQLVRNERERVLQMFVVATIVSIALSLVLASTISNPISDLALAAELGGDKDARTMQPGRVRIPDLTARPDEIGRLSGALRGMVDALYDRIDSNEQFAADVAHEIKNPLASLRSAVGTMRIAKREDQRERLLEVIEHDVRRLDRLVSDISNASRLDSELVKEEEEDFNLLEMVGNLTQYLGEDAKAKGIEFISDLPDGKMFIPGLEARLAQVFVNLITNAVSFCEDGDAIRVWVRKRDNRVLVVVEDTGPGIPDQALHKVFNRFYSQRPEEQFGNNSGLGLAISKQIVEAHGGVIWAENIRPTEADITSDPLGARFVVGLPI